jgi:hypothetical protein
MRSIGLRIPIFLLVFGLFAAVPAVAEDEQSQSNTEDFSEFALQLDTSLEFDSELDWTDFQFSGSRFAPSDGLRFHWPPAMGAGAVPRPNQLANWKPSSGMRVDYSGRDEAVFVRWRLGF